MKDLAFKVTFVLLGIANYAVWHMLVISKYGYNPLTVFPILLYILIMFVSPDKFKNDINMSCRTSK